MARMTQTEIISSLAESTGAKKSDVKALFDALASLATEEVKEERRIHAAWIRQTEKDRSQGSRRT